MSKKIVVSFSGWVEMEPENVKFQSLQDGESIDGVAWSNLTEDERGHYILDSVVDVIMDYI